RAQLQCLFIWSPSPPDKGTTMRRLFLMAALMALLLPSPARPQANWPQFRGSQSAVADGNGLPDRWSTTHNIAWKVDLPGKAWSSPIVWGDKVFVTGVVSANKTGLPKKGLYIEGVIGEPPAGEQQWMVYCIDWKSGKVLWKKTASRGKAAAAIHNKNSL